MGFDSLHRFYSVNRLDEKDRGAYGTVFIAQIDGIDENAICKRLHSTLRSPHNIQKFIQECVTLSQLNHRNCVKFFGVHVGEGGKDNGDISLIMELLPFDLYEVATDPSSPKFETGLISYVRKLSILRDVACGLEYLHSKFIIHRDLTPRNILLTKDMTLAKIADLGNSRYLEPCDDLHRASKLTKYPGNICFMPPEALEEPFDYDFKLDCFSFGIVILALWNQKYLPHYPKETKEHLEEKKELTLRKGYFKCLEEHSDLSDLAKSCLSDDKKDRPTSRKILLCLNFQIGGSFSNLSTRVLKRPCVVSIDFGLPTSRIAYRLSNGESIAEPLHLDDQPISGNAVNPNIPVLVKNNPRSGAHEVQIGQMALQELACCFNHSFEQVLYLLKRNFDAQTSITGSDGRSYLMVEVLAVVLNYLGNKVKKFFTSRGKSHYLQDLQWVFTVDSLKHNTKMLLEAATLAGLFTNDSRCFNIPLTPSKRQRHIEAKFPPCVSIITRSEAAAMQVIGQDFFVAQNKAVLVVNVEGGTIGVSSFVREGFGQRYKLLNLIHRRYQPVSEAFLQYLADKVLHDKDFCSYSHDPIEFLLDLIESFERTFIYFSSKSEDEAAESSYIVNLPLPLYEAYEVEFRSFNSSNIHLVKQKLMMSYSVFEEITSDCVTNLNQAIDDTLQEINMAVDRICLVGGLGGSQYVLRKVRSSYSRICDSITVADESMLTSAKGACYYFDQLIIHPSPAHYGIGCSVPYNPDNPSYCENAMILAEDDHYFCSSAFVPLLDKGDPINPLKEYRCVLTPLYNTQTVLPVSLYRSTAQDRPQFVMDADNGHIPPGLEMVTLEVDIEAGMDTLSLAERQVLVVVLFGRCNVQISTEYNGRNKISRIVPL